MRKIYLLLIALPLLAQQPAPEAKPEQKQGAPAAKAEEQTPAPAPTAEQWLTGTVDFGYRWVTNIGGDFNTYRSVVNLGEGPKLLGLDLRILNPSRHYVDRIDIHASSWGGDPYNTARIDARREGLYQFTWNYTNIAYFNFLPSFADPLRERGIVLNENAFDTFRRDSDLELTLFPGHRIIPYVAYDRNSGRGTGISTFVLQSNEYPLPQKLNDRTDDVRGGVRFEFNKFHLTLEQGGARFSGTQNLFTLNSPNTGNVSTPVFGQNLFMTNGQQLYDVTSETLFSRVLLSANPAPWVDVSGQFLYSRPHSSTNFNQNATGNFFDLASIQFYTGQLNLITAQARQPHPSGSFAVELRPFRRLRILESWMTDRLHNAASAIITDQLLQGATKLTPTTDLLNDRLVMNYNQQELNLLFDLTSKLTLRGGYRYVWGDATLPPALVLEPLGREFGKLRHNVALAGANYRFGSKLSANVDFEASPGDRSYFRTSLNDYQRARIQARYQALSSLQLTANFNLLRNENPDPSIRYNFLSRQSNISAFWNPGGGKRVTVLGDYTRASIHSDITYLIPNLNAVSDFSRYRDNAHIGTTLVDLALPGSGVVQPKISLGGSFFVSAGTRPTRYYQPLARLSIPLMKRVQWNSEWRWYALHQPFYLYEGFRSNQFITGFRLIM